MTVFRTWSDYTYPDSDVLRNKFDLRSAADLRIAEEDAALIRTVTALAQDPVEGAFDREHMKAIHARVFGDVYEWAGTERVGPTSGWMTKLGPSPESILAGDYAANDRYGHQYFPAGDEMTRHFDQYCAALFRDDLRDLQPSVFVDAIAEPWAEINTAHLFREGNTRTQVVFFTYFARHHGHDLDFARFTADREFRHKFNAGRFLAQSRVDYSLLVDALNEVIDVPPSDVGDEPDDSPDDYQPMYSADEYAEKYGDSP